MTSLTFRQHPNIKRCLPLQKTQTTGSVKIGEASFRMRCEAMGSRWWVWENRGRDRWRHLYKSQPVCAVYDRQPIKQSYPMKHPPPTSALTFENKIIVEEARNLIFVCAHESCVLSSRLCLCVVHSANERACAFWQSKIKHHRLWVLFLVIFHPFVRDN